MIPILKKVEAIFNTSIHNWDIKEKNTRTSIIRYINSRLKTTFDMTMSYDKINKKYRLTTISNWNFVDENFYKIKEDLDKKESNFESKLFMETWTYKLMNGLLPDDDEIEKDETENEIEYFKSDHMDYINLYKAKNNTRNTKLKPNRRIKVYKDKHRNKHKGPAFMIEEVEKWDKEGNIHKNIEFEYEDCEIVWEDPNIKKKYTDKKSLEIMFEMFDLYDVDFKPENKENYKLNGYTKDDIVNVGKEQVLWGQNKSLYESDSEEEAEYDLY